MFAPISPAVAVYSADPVTDTDWLKPEAQTLPEKASDANEYEALASKP